MSNLTYAVLCTWHTNFWHICIMLMPDLHAIIQIRQKHSTPSVQESKGLSRSLEHPQEARAKHLSFPLHPPSHNVVLVLLSSMPQWYGSLCRSGEGEHCNFVVWHTSKESVNGFRINSRRCWQLQQLVCHKMLQQICLEWSRMPATHHRQLSVLHSHACCVDVPAALDKGVDD